jgi:hypothetical protein
VDVVDRLSAYDAALARILRIPPLTTAISAERVVRCLFKPAFHAECWIELLDRENDSQMTIRAAAASIWSLSNARSGPWPGDPVTAWVEPAVSIEKLELSAATRPKWRDAVASIDDASPPSGAAVFGLDGMSVDVVLRHEGVERSLTAWFGPFDCGDASHRLVLSLLDTAIDGATWVQSLTALSNARSYVVP